MGSFGVSGLDYGAVFKVAEVIDVTIDKLTLNKLRVIEGAMLEYVAEQANKKA